MHIAIGARLWRRMFAHRRRGSRMMKDRMIALLVMLREHRSRKK